jgi:hypothetical protein
VPQLHDQFVASYKECPDRKKVESRIVPQTTNKFPIRNVAVVDEENWDTVSNFFCKV